MTEAIHTNPASFRDPSGFVFSHNGAVYRQINQVCRADYELLMSSGLYHKLTEAKLLVAHKEMDANQQPASPQDSGVVYKIIKPSLVEFISYPYEWSFSQLKDAALATLNIQKVALEHGMSLKDASAYNIQFIDGLPTMIDTLSFEAYQEGKPWVAYKQFCQHFLAPLALMAQRDVRLSQLLRVYIDGVPLDLASKLLGASSRIKPSTALHIHLHARSQAKHAGNNTPNNKPSAAKLSRQGMLALIHSLESAINSLKWQPKGEQTTWGDYYDKHSYTKASFNDKKAIVERYLERTRAKQVWDLGGNSGVFSRLASARNRTTLCFDDDPIAIEHNYLHAKSESNTKLLPLLVDLTNPSSGIGWAGQERSSLAQRGPADTLMALALIHHLTIGNNVPFGHVAEYFRSLGKYLIIEFVPKQDSMVKRLLMSREDVFGDYDAAGFETAFKRFFTIIETTPIKGSKRTMYLMKSRA